MAENSDTFFFYTLSVRIYIFFIFMDSFGLKQIRDFFFLNRIIPESRAYNLQTILGVEEITNTRITTGRKGVSF